MSKREAPLYVDAQALAVWLGKHRTPTIMTEAARGTWAEVLQTSRRLLVAIGAALTFPDVRDRERRKADLMLLRLRLLLRLARDFELISDEQILHLARRLDPIGRMIGGWRRTARTRSKKHLGETSPMAPTVSCAAVPSGTTRRGRGPPTATGTSPGGGTTTSASGSASRAP